MTEWWYSQGNVNMLKGVEGDTSNPPRLTDAQILDFLRRFRVARESFNRLLPTMLPEEQERLDRLSMSAKYVQPDYKKVEDDFQSRFNKAGVRTAGPRGGQRIGGNV